MRITHDERLMMMAMVTATGATCGRRKVGCVLVTDLNHVLATGYNGPASGEPHCTDTPCDGFNQPSGQGLEKCEAIHAEQNAILQCRDVFKIRRAYCTTMPCVHCVKLLMNTSCREIMYLDSYPHAENVIRLWTTEHRSLIQIDMTPELWLMKAVIWKEIPKEYPTGS